MVAAVCIYCGEAKAHFLDACSSCARVPESDVDCAKSAVLSIHRFEDAENPPEWSASLERLCGQSGLVDKYEFDAQEIDKFVKLQRFMAETSPSKVLLFVGSYFARLFFPAIVLFGILYVILRLGKP